MGEEIRAEDGAERAVVTKSWRTAQLFRRRNGGTDGALLFTFLVSASANVT